MLRPCILLQNAVERHGTFTPGPKEASISEIEKFPALIFTNVSKDDAGPYTCVVGNAIGVAQSTAYLHVRDPSDSRDLLFLVT